MSTKENPYIAIYARKSKFTHSGDSIEIQIGKCRNYLAALSAQNEDTEINVFKDEGYSGGNTNRPEFQNLLDECTSGKVSTLICYRIDRISRNLSDFAQLYEQLKKQDIKFISVNEQFDTSTPAGEAMLKICMVFSELERQTITERIRDNMLGLAKTGRWLGGTTPLGFKSEKLQSSPYSMDNKVRYLYKLKTVPEEKLIFIALLNKYLETGALTSVETYSHQTNLKTRNGNYFSSVSIRDLFRNPVYAAADKDTYDYFNAKNAMIETDSSLFDGSHGLMVYNKTDQSNGKSHAEHPTEEWIIAIGKHHPFISGKQGAELQELLDQSQKRAFKRPRKNNALLSGLVFCGHCNSNMRPKSYNRTDKNGNKTYSYLCIEKERSKGINCDMKNPNGMELDSLVCNEIKKLSEDKTAFKESLNNAEQLLLNASNDSQSEILLLRSSLAEKDKRIKSLVETIANDDNTVASEYIKGEITSLHTQKLDIQKRISSLEDIEQDKLQIIRELEFLKEKLSDFSTAFDIMPIDEKRRVLGTLIDKIVWDGTKVHIYLMNASDEKESLDTSNTIDFSEPTQRGCK